MREGSQHYPRGFEAMQETIRPHQEAVAQIAAELSAAADAANDRAQEHIEEVNHRSYETLAQARDVTPHLVLPPG